MTNMPIDPATILAALSIPVLVVDPDHIVIYATDAAYSLWSGHALLGHPLAAILTVEAHDGADHWQGHSVIDGMRRHFDIRVAVLPDDIATQSGGLRLLMLSDVSKRHEEAARLRHLATVDPLTRLANRRGFYCALRGELQRMRRDHKPLSLLAIDVDKLKAHNDSHGHSAGDLWLRNVGRALAAAARRPGDVPARLGGDEFVVLLPDTDANGACTVAERIHAVLCDEQPFEGAGPTVTIGAATLPAGKAVRFAALLEAADVDLYRSKKQRRS